MSWLQGLRGTAIVAAFSALLSTAAGKAIEKAIEIYAADYTETRSQRSATIRAFADEARGLDTVVARYVSTVLEGPNGITEARRAIYANLLKQQQLLEPAVRGRDPSIKAAASAYEDALLALSSALPKAADVLTMREFWESASRAVETRNELLRRLEG